MDQNKILPEGLAVPETKNQIRWIKAASLGVLTAVSFGLAWKLLAAGLGHPQNLVFWLWPALAAAFGVSFLALLAVVDVSTSLFWAVNAAILGLYILCLPLAWPVITGGLLFFIFVYIFERHVRDDEHSRVDFSINRIVRSSIIFIVYGLLVVLGFNLYQQINVSFQKNPDAVYDRLGHYAAEGLNYLPSGFGNFNPNQSFNDFITQQAAQQTPGFDQAPKSFQDQLIEEFKQGLENKFHIQVNGNPLLGDVVAGAVAEKVKDASTNYHQFFPAIFAVLVVVILRYTAFLFEWLTSLVCWLLYRLLLMTGFFRIEKVKVEVDKLTI